jgi:hypothetical protein
MGQRRGCSNISIVNILGPAPSDIRRRVRNVWPGRQGRPPGPILVHQVRANGSQLRSLQGAEKHLTVAAPIALVGLWRRRGAGADRREPWARLGPCGPFPRSRRVPPKGESLVELGITCTLDSATSTYRIFSSLDVEYIYHRSVLPPASSPASRGSLHCSLRGRAARLSDVT